MILLSNCSNLVGKFWENLWTNVTRAGKKCRREFILYLRTCLVQCRPSCRDSCHWEVPNRVHRARKCVTDHRATLRREARSETGVVSGCCHRNSHRYRHCRHCQQRCIVIPFSNFRQRSISDRLAAPLDSCFSRGSRNIPRRRLPCLKKWSTHFYWSNLQAPQHLVSLFIRSGERHVFFS